MVMYFKFVFMILLGITFFTGCSYKYSEKTVTISKDRYYDYDQPFQSASLENTLKQNKIEKRIQKQIANNNNKNIATLNLNDELYDFYKEWEGVRYKFGGESKDGIDCSAFIQKVFEKNFNMTLPRTTKEQAEIGKEINKNELATGDLIFFKTGRYSRHVGIYIEDGKFIHASTSKGVTISTLDNSYFSKHYWKSLRIID